MIEGPEKTGRNGWRRTYHSSLEWVNYLDLEIQHFQFRLVVILQTATPPSHSLLHQQGERRQDLCVPDYRPRLQPSEKWEWVQPNRMHRFLDLLIW